MRRGGWAQDGDKTRAWLRGENAAAHGWSQTEVRRWHLVVAERDAQVLLAPKPMQGTVLWSHRVLVLAERVMFDDAIIRGTQRIEARYMIGSPPLGCAHTVIEDQPAIAARLAHG